MILHTSVLRNPRIAFRTCVVRSLDWGIAFPLAFLGRTRGLICCVGCEGWRMGFVGGAGRRAGRLRLGEWEDTDAGT
jgi:hypothetical protein